MKEKLSQIIMIKNYYALFRAWRISQLYQVNQIKLFPTNPLPPILLTIVVYQIMFALFAYVGIVSDYLFWFVDLLKIESVLKIDFVGDRLLYDWIGLIIYGYIALAVAFDSLNYLLENIFSDVYIHGRRICIHRLSWSGSNLTSYNLNDSSVAVSLHGGTLRRLLGLQRLSLKIGVDRINNTGPVQEILSPFLLWPDRKVLFELMHS